MTLSVLLMASVALYAADSTRVQWEWWPLTATTSARSEANDTLLYSAGVEAIASSGKYAPFWLQTNRNGRIAASPYGGYFNAGIIKPATCSDRWFDYDFAAELTLGAYSTGAAAPLRASRFPYYNWQQGSVQINQLYAHARLFIVDITAGIRPHKGLISNPSLTSGGLMYSSNAMPMPGISIGIDEYTAFPGLYGYLEFKGHVEHNWISDQVYVQGAKLHYLYVGGRAGGSLPVNVSFEVEHVAQWGGYSPDYGDLGNNFGAWLNACLGRAGGSFANDQLNAQGNHILTQKWQIDVKWTNWIVSAYWQTLSEDNSKAFTGRGTNLADGLWGVCFEQKQWPYISAVTLEYVGTSDQTGPFHDQDGLIYAGNDEYYRNSVYKNGWNYFYRTIGTPFITSPIYNEDGVIFSENLRCKAWYMGLEGDIYGFRWRAKASYAQNYGVYRNGDLYEKTSRNTALLLEVNKRVEKAWGLEFGLRLGADFGTQFGNCFGAMLTIRKQGLITKW